MSAHNKFGLSGLYRKEVFALVDKLIEIGNISDDQVRTAVKELMSVRESSEKMVEEKLKHSEHMFGGMIPHTDKKRRSGDEKKDGKDGPAQVQKTIKSNADNDDVKSPPQKKKKKGGKKERKERNFDFSRFEQRHIAIRLMYEGGRYAGFASQPGEEATVEGRLFEALQRTRLVADRASAQYSRCGRTDRGVSALGQVIALKVRSNFPRGTSPLPAEPWGTIEIEEQGSAATGEGNGGNLVGNGEKQEGDPRGNQRTLGELDYCGMLNRVLPPDIRALAWAPVTEDFSARFSATGRSYRYFFPLLPGMSLARARRAAKLLEGDHDFRNFCKMDIENVTNFRRKIFRADVVPVACCWRAQAAGAGAGGGADAVGGCASANPGGPAAAAAPAAPAPAAAAGGAEDEGGAGTVVEPHPLTLCRFEVDGQAFLWHQVRCMMALVRLVAEGKEAPEVITNLLDIQSVPGKPQYEMAPERPLVLHGCGFRALRFHYQPQVLWNLQKDLEEQWHEATVTVGRLQNYIDEIRSLNVTRSQVHAFVEYMSSVQKGESKPVDLLYARAGEEAGRWCGKEGAKETVPWAHADTLLRRLGFEPGRRSPHESVLSRPRGKTYEERIKDLGPKKREKYLQMISDRKETEQTDQVFFEDKRQEGGLA